MGGIRIIPDSVIRLGGGRGGRGGGLRVSGPSIVYLLRDLFSTPLAAGAVNGTAAEPGPGTRIVVDVENKISIAGGAIVFAPQVTPNWGDAGLRYGGLARAAGRVLVFSITGAAASANSGIGWNNAADIPIWNGFDYGIRGVSGNISVGATSISAVTLATGVEYQIALLLKSIGCDYFLKGGAYATWQMIWSAATLNTATLYPTVTNFDGNFSLAYLQVPDVALSIPIIAYDTFTRSNGALGSTEALGPDGQTTTQFAWTDAIGTWGVATNKAACSALAGGIGAATINAPTADVLLGADLTRAGGNVGLTFRYIDANNYAYAYHDGTNCTLRQIVAGVDSQVISPTAATFSAGARMAISTYGANVLLFYNNVRIGSDATLNAALTGTRCGIYTSDVGNTFDGFAVRARGTGGEYSFLNSYSKN